MWNEQKSKTTREENKRKESLRGWGERTKERNGVARSEEEKSEDVRGMETGIRLVCEGRHSQRGCCRSLREMKGPRLRGSLTLAASCASTRHEGREQRAYRCCRISPRERDQPREGWRTSRRPMSPLSLTPSKENYSPPLSTLFLRSKLQLKCRRP